MALNLMTELMMNIVVMIELMMNIGRVTEIQGLKGMNWETEIVDTIETLVLVEKTAEKEDIIDAVNLNHLKDKFMGMVKRTGERAEIVEEVIKMVDLGRTDIDQTATTEMMKGALSQKDTIEGSRDRNIDQEMNRKTDPTKMKKAIRKRLFVSTL